MFLEGSSEDEVRIWLKKNYSPRKAHHVLAAVRKRLEQIAELPAKSQLGLVILRHEEIYKSALSAGKHAEALRALQELSRLLGLPTIAEQLVARTSDSIQVEKQTEIEEPESSEPHEADLGDLLQLVRGNTGGASG